MARRPPGSLLTFKSQGATSPGMVTIDCTADANDGVTLVTVRLADIDVPTRVRVESRLDGPVWPPRREGLPESGWHDDGFAGVVNGTAVLGYASPASPADPPVELTEAEPVPEAEGREELTTDPESVVRQLGDPAPPADAVPAAAAEERTGTASAHSDTEATTEAATAESSASTDSPGDDGVERDGPDGETPDLPPAVGPWLAEMARRTDRAERLADAETVPAATAAIRDAGGLEGVRDLAAADDAEQLRTLARRARRLADRRAAVTVPVETLDRLA